MSYGTSSAPDTSGDDLDVERDQPRAVLLPRLRPPPPPRPHVERPRLWRLLDQGVAGPLTVVVAPAGWGKTVAVASWAAASSTRLPVCWLDVDPATGTAAGPSLWRQLRAALSTLTLDGCRVDDSPEAGGDGARRAFVNQAALLSAPVVLVVDDAHRLGDPTDVADLAMLATLPTQLRLVVVGRGTLMPLHRLRTEGRLTELGPSALAFTTAEGTHLLAAFGIPAAEALAARLTRATEGWVAGLRLSAAACGRTSAGDAAVGDAAADRAGADAVGRGPAGGLSREIADYLEAEVFAPLPASVREFLVRTSVLDRVNGALADAVAPGGDPALDGGSLLAGLARESGFVLDDGTGPDWYRYHAMFAAFLRAKVGRDVDEDSVELHLRAALWCAANLRAADAVRHAQQAADWTYAACLLVHGPFPIFVDDAFGSFGALADATPVDVAGRCPETAVAVALRYVRAGDVATSAKCLDRARSQSARLPVARRRAVAHAADLVELRRSELAADPTGMLEAARHLLRGCGGSSAGEADGTGIRTGARTGGGTVGGRVGGTVWGTAVGGVRTAQLRTLATAARGRAELWRGRGESAADNLRTAAEMARTCGLPAAQTSSLGALSLLEAMRGRLRAARAHAVEALEQVTGSSEGAGADDQVASSAAGWWEAQLSLAEVAYQRDDLEAARDRLATVAAVASSSSSSPGVGPHLAALAAVVGVRVELAAGGASAARAARRQLGARDAHSWEGCDLVVAAVRAVDVDVLVALGNPKAALDVSRRDVGSTRADPVVLLATARAYLAVGDPLAAAELLAPLLRADAGVGVGEVVAACVLDAVCAARGGDDGRATASLARALALAVDEALLAPFLDAGDEVAELLTVHPSLRSAYPAFTRSIFAGRSALYLRRGGQRPARLVPPARSVARLRSVLSQEQSTRPGTTRPSASSAESGPETGPGSGASDLSEGDPSEGDGSRDGARTGRTAGTGTGAVGSTGLGSNAAAVRPPAPRRTEDRVEIDAGSSWLGSAAPPALAAASAGSGPSAPHCCSCRLRRDRRRRGRSRPAGLR